MSEKPIRARSAAPVPVIPRRRPMAGETKEREVRLADIPLLIHLPDVSPPAPTAVASYGAGEAGERSELRAGPPTATRRVDRFRRAESRPPVKARQSWMEGHQSTVAILVLLVVAIIVMWIARQRPLDRRPQHPQSPPGRLISDDRSAPAQLEPHARPPSGVPPELSPPYTTPHAPSPADTTVSPQGVSGSRPDPVARMSLRRPLPDTREAPGRGQAYAEGERAPGWPTTGGAARSASSPAVPPAGIPWGGVDTLPGGSGTSHEVR